MVLQMASTLRYNCPPPPNQSIHIYRWHPTGQKGRKNGTYPGGVVLGVGGPVHGDGGPDVDPGQQGRLLGGGGAARIGRAGGRHLPLTAVLRIVDAFAAGVGGVDACAVGAGR